jgi:hypothetical protein
MLRATLCSVTALAILVVGQASVDAQKDKAGDKKQARATIAKLDAKGGAVSLKMKDKDGKDVERTFKLAQDIVYLDSTGKVARIDIFTSGDEVLVVEQAGQLKEMRKLGKKGG